MTCRWMRRWGRNTVLLSVAACGNPPTTDVPHEGWLRVTTSTTGADPYEDGYLIVVDSGVPRNIGTTDSILVGPLAVATWRVELRDVDLSCVPAGDSSRTVVGRAADTVAVAFPVVCSPRLDQANLVTDGSGAGCGSPPFGNLSQSFRPAMSPLTTVVLKLRTGGAFPTGGYTTTVRVRSATPTGAVLATADAAVPYSSATQVRDVRFALADPLSVVRDATYVVEWVSPLEGGAILVWMASQADTYPWGNMFGCSGDSTGYDLAFATYR